MKTPKRFCAIMAAFVGWLALPASAEDLRDNNIVRWCIQMEVNRVAELPQVVQLRQLARHQDPKVKEEAAKHLQRMHALAVQAGYNEGFERVMEHRRRANENFYQIWHSQQFARQLARELRNPY